MVELEDEVEQIRASQHGDHAAFETLIRRYQKMIHALTFRMTGSLADSEDLAQETFIQAYQQLANFRGEARFSSWLYRISVNQCLNWQKRSQRREKLHQSWTDEQNSSPPEPDARSQRVQEALLKLHPKQRAAIVLTTFDNLNHAEAAKVLGCSETTVSWRIFAARAKLKRILSKGEADDE
jgi:RNA polymerase sigma-70 factor, ECF subfamily